MKPSEYNYVLLEQLRASLNAFVTGELDIDEIQSALQSTLSRLENDGTDAVSMIRIAEADIEEIRFTRLLDEQRPAALFRLDELGAALSGLGDD